jgi:triosephosphate isomerase (TIM)
MIVINFKTYKQATGFAAVELASICKKVEMETGVRIVAVPQLADLYECVETGVECWVQHVDPIEQGRNTGWIDRETVEEAGAKGTLLNHSEHKLAQDLLGHTFVVVGGGAFLTCVCADSVEEAVRISQLQPRVDFIAYEPPELIGSRDKSVATEKPEVIEKVVKAVGVPVLIGAGVHSVEDVRVGLKLGAVGVLLATDVVLAENPELELERLAAAFKQ